MNEHSADIGSHREDLKSAQQRWIESTKGGSQQPGGGHVYQTTLTDPSKSRVGEPSRNVGVCKMKKIDNGRSVSPKSSPRKTVLTPVSPTFGFCNVPQLNINSFPVTASEAEVSCKPDKEFITGDGKVVKMLRIEEPLQEKINKSRSPKRLKTVIPCKDESISNQKPSVKHSRKSGSSNALSGNHEKVKNKKETYYRLRLSSGFADQLKLDLNGRAAAENGNFEFPQNRGESDFSKRECLEVNENEIKSDRKSKAYDVSKTRDFIKQKRKEREDRVALEKRKRAIEKEEKQKKLNEIRETQKRIMKSIKKRPLDDNLVNGGKSARPQWIGPMEPHKQSALSSGKINVPEPKTKSCSNSITGAISFKKLSQPASPASVDLGRFQIGVDVPSSIKSNNEKLSLPCESSLIETLTSRDVTSPRREPSQQTDIESVDLSLRSVRKSFLEDIPRNQDENETVDRFSFIRPTTPSSVKKTGTNRLSSDITQSPQYVSIMDKFLAECPFNNIKTNRRKENTDRSDFMGEIECDPLNLINSFNRKLTCLSDESRLAPSQLQSNSRDDLRHQIPVKDNEEDMKMRFFGNAGIANSSEDIRLLEASRERVQAFLGDDISLEGSLTRNRTSARGLCLPDNLVLSSHFSEDIYSDSKASSISSRSCLSQMPQTFRYESSDSSILRTPHSVTLRPRCEIPMVDSGQEMSSNSGGYTSESISEVIQFSRTVSRGSTVINEEMSEIHNATSFSSQSVKFNTTSVKNQIQSGIEQLDKVDQDLSTYLISSRRDAVPPINITARNNYGLDAANALSRVQRETLQSSSSVTCASSKEFDLPRSPSIVSRNSSIGRELAQPSDLPSVSLQVVEDLIKEGATIADRNISSLKQKAKSVKSRTAKEIEFLETQRKRLLEAGQDEEARELKRKQRKLLLKMTEEIKEIQRLRNAQENVARQRTLLLRQQQHLIKLQLQAQRRDSVHYSTKTRSIKSVTSGLLGGDYDVERSSTPFRDPLDRVARDLKSREEELHRRKEQAVMALKKKLDLEEKNVKEIEKLLSIRRSYSPISPVQVLDRGTSPFLEIQNASEVEMKLLPAVEIHVRPTSPSESESLVKDYYSDSFEQSSVFSECHPNITLRKSIIAGRPTRIHPIVKPPLSPRATILKRRHSSESDESVAFSQNETLSELSDDKARVCALKQQLKQRKAVWGKLNDEYKKNKKERLKATEKSLISQIQVYDSYIQQIQSALEKEIESGTASATRPQIKQPRFLDRKLSDKFASPTTKRHEIVEQSTNSESSPNYEHNSTTVSCRKRLLDGNRPSAHEKDPGTSESSAKSVEELIENESPRLEEDVENDLGEIGKESVDKSDDGQITEIKTIDSNSVLTESELALSRSDLSLKELTEDLEANVEESLTKQDKLSDVTEDVSEPSSEVSDVDEETLKVKSDKNSESEIPEVISELEKSHVSNDSLVEDETSIPEDEVTEGAVSYAAGARISDSIENGTQQSLKSKIMISEESSVYEPTMKLEGSKRSISELINDATTSAVHEEILESPKNEGSITEIVPSDEIPDNSEVQEVSTERELTDVLDEDIEEETRIVYEETELPDESLQLGPEKSTEVRGEGDSIEEKGLGNLSSDSHPVTEDLENYLQELEKEEDEAVKSQNSTLPEGGVLQMLRDSFQLSSDDNNTWEMNLAHFQDSGPGTPLITALQRERRQNINADMISKQICDMVVQDATTATVDAFSKKKSGLPRENSTKSDPADDVPTILENKEVGENEGFWLGEGLTLQTAREAEQLRLQQLQIEQEIEELEQAQEVVPYYYVRQIPNKPPPPYTPPRQSTPTREETIARILLAAESLWDLEARGENPSTAVLPATYLASVSDPPYRQFMFDLAKEMYLKLRPLPEKPGPPWTITKRFNKPLPPIKCKNELLKYLERETKLIFGFETKVQRENMIMRWTKKRRGDIVDEILIRELQEEESEWSDFTVEENTLKNQIADELISQAIDDAVQNFALIFAGKLSTAS